MNHEFANRAHRLVFWFMRVEIQRGKLRRTELGGDLGVVVAGVERDEFGGMKPPEFALRDMEVVAANCPDREPV